MSTNKFSSRVHCLLSLCFIKPHLYWGRWARAYLNTCSWTITTTILYLSYTASWNKIKINNILSHTGTLVFFMHMMQGYLIPSLLPSSRKNIFTPTPKSVWPSASDFIEQYLLLSGDWWGRCSHFPQSCWWPWPEQSMYC